MKYSRSAEQCVRFNLVMADELGREFESLVRLELGLLGLNTRSVLLKMSRVARQLQSNLLDTT